jgi:hypothetical protein
VRGLLNPHVHLPVLDGVYSTDIDQAAAVFTPTRPPAQSEVRELAERVPQRAARLLRRRGLLQDDRDDDHDAEALEPIEACAQLSLRLGRLGRIDERGVAHEPDADELRFGQRRRSPWLAEHEGFSVHAGVTVRQGDADGRERLCRYVLAGRHPHTSPGLTCFAASMISRLFAVPSAALACA